MRRSRPLALAAAAAVLVASCSVSDVVGVLSGGGLPDGFGGTPTAAPSVPVLPEPTDPAASDPPSASWTTLPVPGESIEWAAPPDWTTVDLATLRQQLQAMSDNASNSADMRTGIALLLKRLEDGDVRLVIGGPTPGGTATSEVSLLIGPRVSDLAAAGAAMRTLWPVLPNSTMAAPEPVSLALGDGLRFEWVQDTDVPAGYVATRNVVVVTLLPDGRCVWVAGSAPSAEDGWPDFMTKLADHIRIP